MSDPLPLPVCAVLKCAFLSLRTVSDARAPPPSSFPHRIFLVGLFSELAPFFFQQIRERAMSNAQLPGMKVIFPFF